MADPATPSFTAVASSGAAPISNDLDHQRSLRGPNRTCRKRPRFSRFEGGGRPPIRNRRDDCVLFPELDHRRYRPQQERPGAEGTTDASPPRLLGSGLPPTASWPTLLARRETWGAHAAAAGAGGLRGPAAPLGGGRRRVAPHRHRGAALLWQRQVLTRYGCSDAPNGEGGCRRTILAFRERARRRIPFTSLGTPRTEAVVGLERTGAYCVTLGEVESSPLFADPSPGPSVASDRPAADAGERQTTCLALRMYGTPSPSRLSQEASASCCRSPLLLTVPLAIRGAENHRRRLGGVFYCEEFLSLTARVPTVVWVDSDWRMGVAWLKLRNGGSRQTRHSLVAFPMPARFADAQQVAVRTLRRDDAAVNLHPSPGNLKRVLWRARVVPVPHWSMDGAPADATTSMGVVEAPGHVLCLREDAHSYRVAWFCESSLAGAGVPGRAADTTRWSSPEGSIRVESSPCLVTFLSPGDWQDCHSHRYSGTFVDPIPERAFGAGLSVVSEARVRLSTVLVDILRRRPKLVSPPHSHDRLPLFSCDLVEAGEGGISLQAVICFDSGRQSILAAFVEIHMLSQSYRELHWTRRRARSNGEPLETVAEALSVNRRMSQQRLGPYRACPEPLRDWSGLCTARSVEPDEWTARHGPEPGKIPWDAIYPDSQVFDNMAVLLQAPVHCLAARSAPVELVYG